MIYIVSRTSEDYMTKPCDEAVLRTFEQWDTRACTEEYFNTSFVSTSEGLWRSKGKNHKLNKLGQITRQVEDEEYWSIEINTIDELNNFVEKYGPIIFESSLNTLYADVPSIEIYDDDRE